MIIKHATYLLIFFNSHLHHHRLAGIWMYHHPTHHLQRKEIKHCKYGTPQSDAREGSRNERLQADWACILFKYIQPLPC